MKPLVKSLFILVFILGGVAGGFLLERAASGRLFGRAAGGDFKLLRSPGDDVVKSMASLFGAAREELLVSARVLNSEALANALVEARARGVSVYVLLSPDLNPSAGRGAARLLLEKGVTVHWVPRASTDQFCVLDRKYVATGSMPWDARINSQTTSSLLLLNGTSVAGAYATIFGERWKESLAQPPAAGK